MVSANSLAGTAVHTSFDIGSLLEIDSQLAALF